MGWLHFLDGTQDAAAILTGNYSPGVVSLSFIVAMMAAYTSLKLSKQTSSAHGQIHKMLWCLAGAASMGLGIWAMHFLGMLALSLPVKVSYNPAVTIISILPAIFSGMVMAVVVNRESPGIRQIISGGILVGGGIGLMHFTGMTAMKTDAQMFYDPLRFAISILVAVLLAIVALSAKRIAEGRSYSPAMLEFGTSAVVGIAVTGMHYTAMWATFFYGVVPVVRVEVDPGISILTYSVGIISVLVMLLATGASMFDRKLSGAKSALQKSEFNLRNIIANVPDGVITIALDGSILSFNAAAERIFGHKADDCLGRNVSMLMRERDMRNHDKYLTQQNRRKTATIFGSGREVIGCRQDKSVFPMYLKVNPIDSGGQRFFVSIVRDITQRKAQDSELADHRERLQIMLDERTEELRNSIESLEQEVRERRRAEEDARHANRSKSKFLANMSHEIRTPLNSILGFSEIIARMTFGRNAIDRYAEYAADIYSSGNHLLEIINDILDLAKVEAGEMELAESSFDPEFLVQDCIRLVGEKASESGLNLSSQYEHGTVSLTADERKLKQILINLLANAIKFTKPGGSIKVRTSLNLDGEFSFEVSDDGIGVNAKDIPTILKPFGQIKSVMSDGVKGTGLGLPMVKSLIELHGGRLTIKSTVGKGTTVCVKLPNSRVEQSSSGVGSALKRASSREI